MTFEEMLTQHQKMVAKLAKLKNDEMELRKALADAAFNDHSEGTHTRELADGRVLKCVFPMNRSVDAANVQAVNEQIHKMGEDARDLFTWKPSVSMTAYKKLSPEAQKIADLAITTRPGSPTLKVV